MLDIFFEVDFFFFLLGSSKSIFSIFYEWCREREINQMLAELRCDKQHHLFLTCRSSNNCTEEKQKGQIRKRSIKGEKVFKGTNVTLWLLNQCKRTLLMREQLSGKKRFCHCQWEGDEKGWDGMSKKEWKGRKNDVEMKNKNLSRVILIKFFLLITRSHDLNYCQI